jgi:hypothetical protein
MNEREQNGRDWDDSVRAEGEVDGIPWRVALGGVPWVLCGYLKLPPGHPWIIGADYEFAMPEAHMAAPSEVTYSDESGWIGFDTGHFNDHWTREALVEAGVVIEPWVEDTLKVLDRAHQNWPWELPRREWTLERLIEATKNWGTAASAATEGWTMDELTADRPNREEI